MAKCYVVQREWYNGDTCERDSSPSEVFLDYDKAYGVYQRIVGAIMLDYEGDAEDFKCLQITRNKDYFEIYDENSYDWDRATITEKELIE